MERLIAMIFELQILSKFALLSVPLPGNYIVMSSIMQPMIGFNVFRSQVGKFDDMKEAEYNSENDLSYLG